MKSQLLPSLAFNGLIIAAGGMRLKGEQNQTGTLGNAPFCAERACTAPVRLPGRRCHGSRHFSGREDLAVASAGDGLPDQLGHIHDQIGPVCAGSPGVRTSSVQTQTTSLSRLYGSRSAR